MRRAYVPRQLSSPCTYMLHKFCTVHKKMGVFIKRILRIVRLHEDLPNHAKIDKMLQLYFDYREKCTSELRDHIKYQN